MVLNTQETKGLSWFGFEDLHPASEFFAFECSSELSRTERERERGRERKKGRRALS